MYKIISGTFGSFEKCTLKNNSGSCLCSFIPGFGATITELQLAAKGKHFQLVDGFTTESQLRSNERSRNIHLIPFPNRIKDGQYSFGGEEHRLSINKPNEHNAIHGFIWNKPFETIEKKCTPSSAYVMLNYHYKGENEGYPFPFTVSYKYELSEVGFAISSSVTNSGKEIMPLGIGWHPYFTFHKRVDELMLQLPACNILETNERLIPTGKRILSDGFESLQKIGTSTFDTAFELKGDESHFETKLHDPESGVTINLQQDLSFRYLQVYIPLERNCIALEPMTCPANSFNSGEGLIVLKPGKDYSGTLKVCLS